ncbi:alpha/beta fold hydrolase [Protaetiibacter sp. SSC-01]|uniref:alpha/beta fold hydrolase n=1 Tax=Protaetiibacter sp. SSC-01 TaxID=2759943 RepID=UPI0016570D27|nr:alpha/beta fold hydrolase [Protaetiibacter sp. SSC-01]QNO37311.1 alpha/beta fold hydrolase [Protaetiibacter sp. SSC-01]
MPATTIATGVRAASALSPRLGGAVAYRLFFSTRPRMRVPERWAAIDADARRETIIVGGRRVVVSTWGEVGPLVVLVHGWRGRAAQFAPLVPTLRAAGYRALAFDAPAHGGSQGGPVDIRDWIAVLTELQRRHGRFAGLLGHSFGALAALTAVRHGLETDAVVAIAGAGRPQSLLDEFARRLGLDAATRADFERRFLARVGETAASAAARYDAVAHPLDPGVPLLVVHGDRDRELPVDESIALAEATTGARLVVVREAGHGRVLSALETSDALLAHLDRAARGSVVSA